MTAQDLPTDAHSSIAFKCSAAKNSDRVGARFRLPKQNSVIMNKLLDCK